MKASSVRAKGHSAERYYAKVFREDLGFTFCKTSRQSNRMLDDAGIDLNFLPFNVQIKAGYANGLNEFKTLEIIRERLTQLFPSYDPVHKNVDILIHKKDTGKGKKKDEYDELVFFWFNDFWVLFPGTLLGSEAFPCKAGQKRGWTFKEVLTEDSRNMMMYSRKESLSLMVMSFDKFKELVKSRIW